MYLAIRIRGRVGIPPDIEETLKRLNLHRKFNASLLPETPSIIGMLKKVSDYITWGEITKENLVLLLKKRGRLKGDKRITEENLNLLNVSNFEELADMILKGNFPSSIKKTFRLTPPSGGFKGSTKKHVNEGGELGYRGMAINDLLLKMI
ncbi:MAG: 50S ribosomal protein L30 [Candidatus Methanomethylicota archaeon]|jgi:large subunit ribosomal protein L30|uniref:Large ribosomal subunit protein uL30 n=1 Tax=Thermoproteota archaeon TaxID=2056631 RepID=A0A520KEC7_9CREN|nr:MAG: 50S ribosomal protein L30 [Candidatus Verstraetearchaeota archaeon]TDA38408.1 MAG: 50S ribosomal protein L30 [Candidatus Verstraetearchaeota archaeon]